MQKALDACGPGKAVVLQSAPPANAFLSGPLELRQAVTLVVDKGVTLYESVDPAVLETSPGSCGLVSDAPGRGCRPLLSASHISGAGIMGDGVIDGRGNVKLLGKNVTAWDLAEQARPGGGQKVSRLIVTDHADNFTLYRITLKNSPNFHVSYNAGNGFTVWGVKIDTPGKLARNTDGIDPGNGSRNITVTHSFINTGDDDIAIKGGPGGLTDMTVSHNHFYRGHGMSIGSETSGGVSRVRVVDLTLDGPDNAIRIKSNAARGGLVHDIRYDDVCIRNSPNPLFFDTAYTANGSTEGTLYPEFTDITLHNVRISGGGRLSFNGFSRDHRVGIALDGVLLTDAAPYKYSLHHADLHLGPGPVNLHLAGGEDTTTTGTPGKASLPSCADRFVPFPR
ncbi:MAG: glycoside hydrolase family 28 protein [Acidobacteriota bacterium]|nr:glycoside hydrolase family 28 protein [Acidobacteriota bacterium]